VIPNLDDLHQEQDENDKEDETDASTTVVAETWSHAVTTEAEHKDQDEQQDKHYLFSPCGEDSPDGGCDAGFVISGIKSVFSPGCLILCAIFGMGVPPLYPTYKPNIFIDLRSADVCKIVITNRLRPNSSFIRVYRLFAGSKWLSPLLWDRPI
jgi:hypothetical protein